jgi:hypothetical protein
LDQRENSVSATMQNNVRGESVSNLCCNSVLMEQRQASSRPTTLRARDSGIASTLPFELLSIIFLSAVGLDESPFNSVCTPAAVSKVCSKWRDVALATPKLWSKIVVDTVDFCQRGGLDITSSRGRAMAAMATWCERANRCGSRFMLFTDRRKSVEAGNSFELIVCDHIQILLEAVFSLSLHWTELSLPPLNPAFWPQTNFHFPHLESFEGEFGDVPRTRDIEQINAFLPKLCKYDIFGVGIPTTFYDIKNVSWSRMTSISICTDLSEDRFRGLQLCALRSAAPVLTHLAIDGLFYDKADSMPVPAIEVISFPQLTSLKITSHSAWELNHFVAPKLEDLDLEPFVENEGCITSFISRSACSVKTLTLSVEEMDEDIDPLPMMEFAELILSVPRVTSFNLIGTPRILSHFLTLLLYRLGDPTDSILSGHHQFRFLPYLKHLKVDLKAGNIWEIITNAILHRRFLPPGAPGLSTLDYRFYSKDRHAAKVFADRWKQQGMQVELLVFPKIPSKLNIMLKNIT